MSLRFPRTTLRSLLAALFIWSPGFLNAQGVVNAKPNSGLADPKALTAAEAAPGSTSDLMASCRSQFVNAKKNGVESFGCYWTRLYLETSADADNFFGGLEIGNSIALRLGEVQTSLYTELLSDNLFLSSRLGYARMGFATQVSAAKDSGEAKDKGTVDQFFQGGGNAMLFGALPLAVWINFAVDTSKGPLRQFNSFATVAITGDVPKLGTSVTETAASVRAGVQGDFTWRTHNERFGLFMNLRGNYVRGLSDAFYRNLLGSSADVANWGIIAGDYSLGVDLSKLVRVGVSGGVSTHSSVHSPARLSVMLLPQKQ